MILQENSRNDHMVSFMVMATVYCVGYLGQDWSSSECMLCSYASLPHLTCTSLSGHSVKSLMPHEAGKEQRCLWTAGERHSARQYPVEEGKM